MRKTYTRSGPFPEYRFLCYWADNVNRPKPPEGGLEKAKQGEQQEEFDKKRDALNAEKDDIVRRIEGIQSWVSNGKEWEDYKQYFIREFSYWNGVYERAAGDRRAAAQKRVEEVIHRYERQIAEREAAAPKRTERLPEQGDRGEQVIPVAERKPEGKEGEPPREKKKGRKKREAESSKRESGGPERKAEKTGEGAQKQREEQEEKPDDPEVQKIDEAKRTPNTWCQIAHGAPGYLYCFVQGQGKSVRGLYSWNQETGQLSLYSRGKRAWSAVEWKKGIPTLPGKREEEEARRNQQEAMKLEEARRTPNTWRQIEHGTEGFLYCYATGGGVEGYYAWDQKASRLLAYDQKTRSWGQVEWRRGIPVPPGMEGKIREEERRRREEEGERVRREEVERKKREEEARRRREEEARKREEEAEKKRREEERKREEERREQDPKMVKHREKLKEIERHPPNTWVELQAGTPGYLYCRVPGKGFYAYNVRANSFWKNDEGTPSFTQIERTPDLPKLPHELEEEKRKKEEEERRGREEREKREQEGRERRERERREREERARREREEEEERRSPEFKKLEETRRNPDRWCTLEHGAQGFLYCYATKEGVRGLYAWNEQTNQLSIYDLNAKTWKRVEWRTGIPIPPGMIVREGKIEETDPKLAKFKRKLEEAKRNPNTWRSLQEGTEGYLYCYVEGRGFFAFRLSDGELQKAEGMEFKKTRWSREVPRPPAFALNQLGPVARIGSQEIGSPAYEGLSGMEYAERVKEVIRTPDAYFTYEELFLDPAQPDRRFGIEEAGEAAIRLHGKDVCGVSQIAREIQSTYGIAIETETITDTSTKAQRHSIRSLKLKVEQVKQCLEKYPIEFIRNSGLRKVLLFGSWKMNCYDRNAREWKWVPCGGYCGSGGTFAAEDVLWAFHHELRHQADRLDSETDNDTVWARTAHGSDYLERRVYSGGSGWDAIMAGTASGERPSGFARKYGQADQDEDQATVAQFMLNGPTEHNLLLQYARNEPPLAKKIEMTKAFYKRMSGNRMDDQFWDDLRRGVTIDRRYWERRARESARG